jgi:pilus assembly protein FimV
MRSTVLGIVLLLATGRASALGLGPIQVSSKLNEPFAASVPITGASARSNDSIVVTLGTPEQFEKAALPRPFVLAMLKFKVVQSAAGPQRIDIRSSQPIKEPALDFLIEVDSPDGRLLQRYTVLLDPPGGLRKRDDAPAPVEVQPAPESAPAPGTSPAQESIDPAPAANAPAPPATSGSPVTEYGPTVSTDTLWSVANKLRPDASVTIYQVMYALMRRNPQAFLPDKVTRLRTGVTLTVPSTEEMAAVPAADARADVRRHLGS